MVIDAQLNDEVEADVYRTMSHFQTHSITIGDDDFSISLTGTRGQVLKLINDLQKSLDELGW